jgi:hypothetical protein
MPSAIATCVSSRRKGQNRNLRVRSASCQLQPRKLRSRVWANGADARPDRCLCPPPQVIATEAEGDRARGAGYWAIVTDDSHHRLSMTCRARRRQPMTTARPSRFLLPRNRRSSPWPAGSWRRCYRWPSHSRLFGWLPWLRSIASRDGGFSSGPIAGGDFYAHWRPPADTSGSTPQFGGGRDSNHGCDLSKRLQVTGAVNVVPPPDVVVQAE